MSVNARSGKSRTPSRMNAESSVSALENAGYSIHRVRVSSEGNYAVADADWNYKDIPHLNVVHTQVRGICGTIEDDLVTSLFTQRVAGISVPIIIVNHADSDTSQTYFTTLGPFVLIVHTRYIELEPNRTRVETTYHIGGRGLWRLLFPILARVLRKNYAKLMSEDLPMRDRRGELRSRGFTYQTDGAPRSFPETADLLFKNVVPPKGGDALHVTEPLAAFRAGADVFVGSDDDRGLRLVRQGDELLAFPRICLHEGAGLDCASLSAGKLSCPWHAMKIVPVLRLALRQGEQAEKDGYRISVGSDEVAISIDPRRVMEPAVLA